MSELHFYDFDGTLFRSPNKPLFWDGDWWSDTRSLLPPCVPHKPGSDWWVGTTVSDAKKSISDSDVFAVMMTGRNENTGLRYRIPELLKQKGLNFDEVHLSPSGDSEKAKMQKVFKLLSRYPHIDTVRFWDDRPSHLRHFESLAGKMGIDPENIHTTLVRAKSKDPECGTEDASLVSDPSKVHNCHYVGIFLDARSKATLIQEYGISHDRIKADHVTLCLKPPRDGTIIGDKVRVKVVGYAEDDLGQAVVVSLPSDLKQEDRTPHITVSHSRSVASKYSNDLLKKGFSPVSGPTLTGVVDSFPHSLRSRPNPKRVAARWRA
jgi:hypothetical protein